MSAPYERQVFVCTFGPWCRLDGADLVRDALKRGVKQLGLVDTVRITKSGCLGQCGHGPMVVSWPDNTWYCKVKPEDAPEILESHITRGTPVERLRYRPEKPGGNKTAEVKAKEAETGKITE